MRVMKLVTTLMLGAALTSCMPEQGTSDAPATQTADSVADRALALLSQMTLEEKIGQVIQADISAVTPEDLRTYNLGSVLNGGNSAPGGGKVAEPEEWIELADAFWDASTDTSDGGLGIPAIWGTDAVHGHNNVQTATIFPHNSALGATHNPDLMRQIGDVTAREIRATGLDWTFAPTLAVARDDRWGRAYESYSENPELVAEYAAAIIEGLQGLPGDPDFLIGENVMATAKHFVADGGTQYGIDKGDTVGELQDILDIHAAGYGQAIELGIQSVMASFSSVNGEKMHGSEHLLQDVLRDQYGFEGFVVGDWNGHAEVPGCTATDCVASLDAGVDMYMAPDSWRGVYDSLLAAAEAGELDLERLDEAVLRILEAKIRSGLLDAGRPSERATSDVSILGNDEHRAVARQAVRESLVLLRNDENVLPLAPGLNVMVAGSGADSMQQQTGGWTLNWQGTGNSNEEFLTGETIFSGISTAMSDIGGEAFLSEDGSYESRPDVAIVVFGEQPYAEYLGDRTDLVFEFDDGENLQLIRELKADGIPVVSVFLTGRPLWVNPHLNASDAFVVGWLPGSEGGGVADVLVADENGDARHDFNGRLSFSWPSDGMGNPINSPEDEGVLFPFGYGLTYADRAEFTELSEESGVDQNARAFDGSIVDRGRTAPAFLAYLGDSSNANLPIMANALDSIGGGISIRGVDYRAQEDARELTWSGNGAASFGLRAHRPIDLTSFGDLDDLAITVDWQLGLDDGDNVEIGMACGEGCGATVDVSEQLRELPQGEWTTSSIAVSCFVEEGLTPENVTRAFSLTGDTAMDITVHSVSIEATENTTISCQ